MYKKVAEKLYENFVVNTSVAAVQQKESKYFTVKSPITVSLIEEMLRGGHSIGTYQQQTNQNKLRWICFDFDCKNQNKEELKILKREYVDTLILHLEELQISYLLEFSGRRGIHVWIFLDQVITKDLAFTIVTKLRDIFYYKIVMDGRFGLDCFPKTGSGKVNNKYGLQVKIPLSRHQLGAYSYFIDKNEEQFNSVESLDEEFLRNQLKFLDGIKKNSIEELVDKLAITQKISSENIIKYHKKILVGKREITLEEIREVFVLDEVLSSIWLHITDGRLTSLERVVLLGVFGHMENGEQLLLEILKKQQNYNSQITHNMIAKYKKYYFPITFNYLYELYNNRNCPVQKRDMFIDEYIFKALDIPYHMSNVSDFSNNINFVESIVEKEINYFMYNDEVYHLQTLYKLNSFSYYDYCKIEEIISNVESGKYSVPSKIEFKQYIRNEEDKQRILISLGAQERVITTALANKMIMYLQKDYSSYSYHLNFGIGGDVFYPWISSWMRFKNDVSQYFSYPIFENYACAKIDIKGFYDNIYLQTMFENILQHKEIKQYEKFKNIYKYLNSINEKIMLESVGDLRGVPQGPAYARVLAEIVLDEMITKFFINNSIYQVVKNYRYVDDMFMFFPNTIDGEILIRDLADFLEAKGLYLNLKKTKNYGKIGDLSLVDKLELQEFRDLNYDVFQVREDNWINTIDKAEFENVYIRYIYRKNNWDINDANLIFSEKVSNTLQEKYFLEFYERILSSQYGRGSLFRKFYMKIFNDITKSYSFFDNQDYMLIPVDSINYKNMLCMLVLCIDNISLNIDKDGIFALKEYLKKCEVSEEAQNAEILLELKLQEKEEREC